MNAQAMTDEHGPHREALLAQVARLNALSWLAPDAAMDTQSTEAQQWIRDQVDQHLAALAEFQTEAGALHSPSVEIFRAIPALAARALSSRAVTGLDNKSAEPTEAQAPMPPTPGSCLPALTAHARAWRDALSNAFAQSYNGTAYTHSAAAIAMVPHVYYNLPKEHVLRSPWLEPLWSSPVTMNHPGYPAITAHLRWVARFGMERPSPWDPIIAMFERGLWPAVSNDGAVLIWIPLRVNGVLVADESGSSNFQFPQLFSTGNADELQDLRGFHERGFAPLPLLCIMPPTPNIAPPRPQMQPPSPVTDATTSATTTATATATASTTETARTSVAEAQRSDGDARTQRVPWYRRLFGRK